MEENSLKFFLEAEDKSDNETDDEEISKIIVSRVPRFNTDNGSKE